MPKLPRVTARGICSVLEKLHPKVLKGILTDADLSVEALTMLL